MPSAQLEHSAEKTEAMSYFVDQVDLLSVNEDYVNPYQYPPVSTAMLLNEAFFHALHGAFYFIERGQFLNELMTVKAAGPISNWSQRRFLAVSNLVWATAARWLQMTKLGERTDAEDHLIYYARARSLGLDHRIQFDCADVESVQSMGILAFYLLINNSTYRYAWPRPLKQPRMPDADVKTGLTVSLGRPFAMPSLWACISRLPPQLCLTLKTRNAGKSGTRFIAWRFSCHH